MKNKFYFLFMLLGACTQNTPQYIGAEYLNKKYAVSPLGEEKAPDIDPLIRFDAFDCTTFVETSLAGGDMQKLNKIRYQDGKIDFLYRNHFTELDWLQNNSDMLENVSHEYGQTATSTVNVDKKTWFKRVHNIDTDFEKQTVNIEYIPYENLSKINIQSPIIVLFIHDGYGFQEKIGTDLSVVHMGFLLPNNILRHASNEYGRVMDVDFEEYVEKRKQNKHNIGIALVKIK